MINCEKKITPGTGETLIHFVREDKVIEDIEQLSLSEQVVHKIAKAIKRLDFKGKKDKHISIDADGCYDQIILYGIGKDKDFSPLKTRDIFAYLVQIIADIKSKDNVCWYPPYFPKDMYEVGKHISLGWYLGQYRFDKYKEKSKIKSRKSKTDELHINFITDVPEAFKKGLVFGKIIADGVTLTRNLVNEPASHMHPDTLVAQSTAIASTSPDRISVQILNKKECTKLGMGSFLGVAQGSEREPRFIILHYSPQPHVQNKNKKSICLVGKSITFDSGGLSLKPSKSMETMKMDMAGGATVLGIFDILSRGVSVFHEVWGILPACENMPSGGALRPGDVVQAIDKQTIEVLNTDAEGRLTLADGVAYAQKYLKPDLIIDLATLTGACMVALGEDIAGLFGNNASSVKEFIKHAQKEGEEVWELPLYREYIKLLKSDVADIKNIGGNGYGGAITGALFIGEFVKKTKWLHIDIAGPAYNSKGVNGSISKGGTGWGVLSIMSLLTTI